jgi:hypothetical protein
MVRIEYERQLSFREKRQLMYTERLVVGAQCHRQRMKIASMQNIPLPGDRIIGATPCLAHEKGFLQAQVINHGPDHLGRAPQTIRFLHRTPRCGW